MATMNSCLTANSSTPSTTKTTTVSSVYLTLPLACQVCLGKVKDPVVCANHHVFCSACMNQWLKSSKSSMCPTCRVPITDKQPCKRIIGSMDSSPTIHDKSIKENMRKARFEILYQEYENEIKGLEQKLEECQTENHHIKEINNDLKTRLESTELRLAKAGSQDNSKSDAVTEDINTILKLSSRLQDMINYNKTLKDENDTYQLELRDSRRQNQALKEEIDKLLQSNNFSKSPQRFSRYTVAALQTKVDHYEREITRLRRALDRSDEYVDELKRQLDGQKRQHDGSEYPVRSCSNFSIHNQTENLANERSVLSHDKVPQCVASTAMEVSRIDELANIALATRHIPYATPNGDNSPTIQSRSPNYVTESPREQTLMHSGFSNRDVDGDSSSDIPSCKRSIFEDSSKFPACAKLIELTKVRRDGSDQPTNDGADIVSLDVTQNGDAQDQSFQSKQNERSNLLKMLFSSRESISSPISTNIVGREGSAFSVVSNQIPRSTESLLETSSQHRQFFSEDLSRPEFTVDGSPSPIVNVNVNDVNLNSQETQAYYGEEDQGQSQSYPSSVVLTNSQSSIINCSTDNDVVFAKRIKIEQED